MINTQDLDYITQQVQQYPSLSHAANILTKVHSNLNSSEENALTLLAPQYAHFHYLKGSTLRVLLSSQDTAFQVI